MPHSYELSNNPYPFANQYTSLEMATICLISILILFSHLHLGLPKDLFPACVHVKLFPPTFFHYGYMTCPCQSSRVNHPDYTR